MAISKPPARFNVSLSEQSVRRSGSSLAAFSLKLVDYIEVFPVLPNFSLNFFSKIISVILEYLTFLNYRLKNNFKIDFFIYYTKVKI